MSKQTSSSSSARNYLVKTYFTQEEVDLLKTMMLETKLSDQELMVSAFRQMAVVRQRMIDGYEQKFLHEETGEEFVEKRIILPGRR